MSQNSTVAQQQATESGPFIGYVRPLIPARCIPLWGTETTAAPLSNASASATPMLDGPEITLFGTVTDWAGKTSLVLDIEFSPNNVLWIKSGLGSLTLNSTTQSQFSVHFQCAVPFLRCRIVSDSAGIQGQLFCAMRS